MGHVSVSHAVPIGSDVPMPHHPYVFAGAMNQSCATVFVALYGFERR